MAVESTQSTIPSIDGRRLFLSWEPSNSRSETTAAEFGAECINIHYFALKKPWVAPFKYVLQSLKSWWLLAKRKPQVVFVQNPPFFAPLAVWVYCRLTGASLIIDSHTGAFVERKWTWLSFIHRFVAKRATVNIVTNSFLGNIVDEWGADYFVFADVPTEFPDARTIEHKPENLITVINTFSFDEPLGEVLEAAHRVPNVQFMITGDVSRCSPQLMALAPKNVTFTGFMSRKSYTDTVFSSDAVVVLTTEDHTMQRGAYEAMSMEVPVITSDWPILKETFYKGVEHVDNSPESIADAVQKVISNKPLYKTGIKELKAERRAIWAEKSMRFREQYLQRDCDSKGTVNDVA